MDDKAVRDLFQIKQFLEANGLLAYANTLGKLIQDLVDKRQSGDKCE